MLHGIKGLVGSLRNYRIVCCFGEGEFCVAVLTAIATSNAPEAKALLECTDADVFNYLDRHSDRICFLTVHEPVQAVLRSVGHVKLTLAPEPFRVWACTRAVPRLLCLSSCSTGRACAVGTWVVPAAGHMRMHTGAK